MNALFEIIKTVILTVAIIKTSSYGIWCIKGKNAAGGIMLFCLCVAAVTFFIFNEARLYI